MKTKIILFVFAFALVVSSCSNLEDSRNISFVSREANQRTLDLLNDVSDWAKETGLKKNEKELNYEFKKLFLGKNGAVSFSLLKDLINQKKIEEGEIVTIKYSYYKNAVCNMKMPDGTAGKYKFKEIVAEVERPSGKKLLVDLRSLNEVLIEAKPDISVEIPMEFSIQKGENIFHHLPCEWVIMVSETFGLPMFKGKDFFKEDQISPEEARAMLRHHRGQPKFSVYTEPLYEFSLKGRDPKEWKLNGLCPSDFKEGFAPNFIKTKVTPPEHRRRERR